MKKIGKREFDMEEVKKSISRKELKARAKQVTLVKRMIDSYYPDAIQSPKGELK